MNRITLVPLMLLLSCLKGNDKSIDLSRYDELDSAKSPILIKLSIDLVKIGKNKNFPLGMGIKYSIKNNSGQKYFFNFKPAFLVSLKDGNRDFFVKRHDPLEVIVPFDVMRQVNETHCSTKPKMEVIENLCDSIFDQSPSIGISEKMFCESFLFLEPGEIFECTESITSLLFSGDSSYYGQYEFYFKYDTMRILSHREKIPKVYKGYKRCESNIESNHVFLNVR